MPGNLDAGGRTEPAVAAGWLSSAHVEQASYFERAGSGDLEVAACCAAGSLAVGRSDEA